MVVVFCCFFICFGVVFAGVIVRLCWRWCVLLVVFGVFVLFSVGGLDWDF